MGNVRLAKLSALHVERLYADMEAAGVSAAMQKKVGTCLGTALRHACRLRLLGHNPVADVPRPKPARQEIHPLDPDQAARFLDAARQDRLFPMYALALDSGMRQGELFALHWPDIDFGAGSVQVRRSLEEIAGKVRLKEVKTARSRRRIELSGFTLKALNEHREAMLAEGMDVKAGPVFVAPGGGFLHNSNVQHRSFEPLLARAELLAIRFHDLRHTCATLLLMAGENVKVVSERLGHSSVVITLDTYSHVLPSMGKRAAETMDKILGRKPEKAVE